MDTLKIKGSGLAALNSFVRDRFGEAGRLQWLDSLNDEQRSALESPFASSWYDYKQMYSGPIRVMCERFFPGKIIEGARTLGIYAAEKQLTGIYRVILKLGSPNMMISAANKTWTMFHSTGAFAPIVNEKGRAIIRASGMPEFDNLVAQLTAAWIEKALEMTGGKDGRVDVFQKREPEGTFFEFELHWKS